MNVDQDFLLLPGTRVKLPANKAEGWPEEYGSVLAYDHTTHMLTVRVDRRYRETYGDDGMRETLIDYVELT